LRGDRRGEGNGLTDGGRTRRGGDEDDGRGAGGGSRGADQRDCQGASRRVGGDEDLTVRLEHRVSVVAGRERNVDGASRGWGQGGAAIICLREIFGGVNAGDVEGRVTGIRENDGLWGAGGIDGLVAKSKIAGRRVGYRAGYTGAEEPCGKDLAGGVGGECERAGSGTFCRRSELYREGATGRSSERRCASVGAESEGPGENRRGKSERTVTGVGER